MRRIYGQFAFPWRGRRGKSGQGRVVNGGRRQAFGGQWASLSVSVGATRARLGRALLALALIVARQCSRPPARRWPPRRRRATPSIAAAIVVDMNSGIDPARAGGRHAAPSGLADQDDDALCAVRLSEGRQAHAELGSDGDGACREPGADQARPEARRDHQGQRCGQGAGDAIRQRRRRDHRREPRRAPRRTSPS